MTWREIWRMDDDSVVAAIDERGTVMVREGGEEIDADGEPIDRHATFWTVDDLLELSGAAVSASRPPIIGTS